MPSSIVNKKIVDIVHNIVGVADELVQEYGYRAAGLSEKETNDAIAENRSRASAFADPRLLSQPTTEQPKQEAKPTSATEKPADVADSKTATVGGTAAPPTLLKV